MTTETMRHTRVTGVRVLLGAAGSALVVGLVVSVLAAVLGGGAAAYGALAGTVIALVVLASGALLVNAVAALMPSASLLVALLTYTLQVVVLALVFVVMTRSGALDSDLDRRWLAGALIATTFAWLATQIGLATRERIPAYDLGADNRVVVPPNDSVRAPSGGEG